MFTCISSARVRCIVHFNCFRAIIVIKMGMCFAPDCKHYSERDTCKFFTFPKDIKEKKRWIKLIRRQDKEPTLHSRVCSCHFENADKSNKPTLFEHNSRKRFTFDSPERQKKIRAVEADVGSEACTVNGEEITNDNEDEASSSSSDTRNCVLLQSENYFLTKDLEEATKKLSCLALSFSFENIADRDDLVVLYTGLPNKDIYLALFNLVSTNDLQYYSGKRVQMITPINQLLLTLYKLRLNTPHADVAVRFNCSTATVSNVFLTWLHLLHEIIFEKLMAIVPSRANNSACLPSCFSLFPNTRMIIDCTEITSEVPHALDKQRQMYSHYKHRNTLKGLVGVAPNGVVTFVSELYCGSTSDKKIVKDCGVLKVFVAGDLILADKGFLISDILPPGVSVNIPPFLFQGQFTPDEIMKTRAIARARIHVERAICRIKGFKILRLMPISLMHASTKIWQVCAALTNFQYPLIKEVEMYYKEQDIN